MNEHSEENPDWEAQRNRIIGLGETSLRKSYYPELQQRILELEKKNRELQEAYAHQTAVEEELRQQFDETGQKEQELRESEERFRQIFENSPLGMTLVTPDFRFFSVNRAWESMTGYTEEELLNLSFTDITHPDHLIGDLEHIRELTADKIPIYNTEKRYIRKDSSILWGLLRVTPIRNQQGTLRFLAAQIEDITERKQVEDALRENEIKYRTLFDNSSDAILIHDMTGRILDSNQVLCDRLGYSREELLRMTPRDFDSPEYAERVPERIRQLMTDKHLIFETCNVRKDGIRIPTEVNARIIDYRGHQVCLIVGRDITERKRGEDALRESEKKYRNIVETTPDLIWEIDVQGNFTYLSPQILDLFGYRAEDLLKKPFFILIPPDQIPAVKMAFERQVAGASAIVTLEVIARHADGRLMDMEIRSANATDENGKLMGFRGITRDISERKQAEERIRASEEMFRSLVHESADGLSLMDEEGRVIEWNDAMVKLSGIPREEAVGAQQADVVVSMMVPENQTPERIEMFRQAIREAQQTGKSFYFSRPIEARILRRDGSQLMINQVAFPIQTAKGYRIGSIMRDITESKSAQDALKVSEERYRSLVDITDTGYLVLDNRGLIIDANEVYLKLTGRQSLAELIGHTVTEWTAPYDLERNAREVKKCLTTGYVRGLEIDYIRPDGTIQPVEINATVFHAGSGAVILTVCRDISERKRTLVSLQQARNKLNLLNAVTFQDIQTAAFSLSAYQELVKTVQTDAKAKSYLEKQELFLKKMVDTLEFAKNYQEMGMHPPRWQSVRQVFLYAISHLDFLHMKQNLQLEHLEIFADPLFEKALFNIMENVLSHGVRATEVTLQYEEKPDHIRLIIEDNGVGIPPEEKNMIFDRGYGKGSGLGLFLVREVLSITGMTIRETGIPGKGTRFEITVPKGMYRHAG